jgi:4-aminobutyrate aminotransferase
MAKPAGRLMSLLQNQSKDAKQAILSHLAPAVAKGSDLIAEHGSGSWVWTVGGKKVLDFGCGIGTLSLGHCHPNMVRATSDQAAKLIQGQQNQFMTNTAQVALLDRLLEVTPPALSRFFFANSGSEVVENAVKIARGHTGRTNIICFDGGFHGRTYGAMALTTSKTIYRQGFAPLMPQVFTAPYPNCLHCKARQTAPDGDDWYKLTPNIPPFDHYEQRRCCMSPLDGLKWMLKMQTAPSETAAVIIEPILGEGGFLTPPPGFLKGVRELCDQHGMLLIMDEVQAGVGRTGKWWGHQHFEGADPDILLFAKGIASGYPFAGLATKDSLWEGLPPGTMGGTFGGNALGCAVATAVIDTIQEENLLQNAAERGSQLAQGLVKLAESYPIIDVRGRGLMVAMELGGPGRETEGAPYGIAATVVAAARDRGLLILTAGARESIRFLPALNVKKEEVEEALSIVEQALADTFDTA